MKKAYWVCCVILFLTLSVSTQLLSQDNNYLKKKIIEASVNSYSGSCPCPYNRDRAGRKCGKRSAYNRTGGHSPICYPADVTQEMVERYKDR